MSLTFKNDKLIKITGANTTQCQAAAIKKRQAEKVCIEVDHIDLLQAYLAKLPLSSLEPNFMLPKNTASSLRFRSSLIDESSSF
jgi:hypothetical protein